MSGLTLSRRARCKSILSYLIMGKQNAPSGSKRNRWLQLLTAALLGYLMSKHPEVCSLVASLCQP